MSPYRKRTGSHDRRGRIPHRVDISERPAIVDTRERAGDWEGDTIVGLGKSALVTIVDRKTGLLRMGKVARPTAELTAKVMIERLLGLKTHTLTLDNGREFCQHRQVSEVLGVEIFFAQPYHSWERGSNENVNSLVRRYFPKRTNFDEVSDEGIQAVEDSINMRPRKRLGYKCPAEFIDELI